MHLALLLTLSLVAPGAHPDDATPPMLLELSDLRPLIQRDRAALEEAERRVSIARLRANLEQQHVVQVQRSVIDHLQQKIDRDVSLQLMPHEVSRLRAEASLLDNALESLEDASTLLRAGLSNADRELAEQSWSARRALDPRAQIEAAEPLAPPAERERVRTRVENEIARIARDEHRIDDLEGSVIPDLALALRDALVDLEPGGAMLDVIEANQRLADARQLRVVAALDREVALIRLALLTGHTDLVRTSGPPRLGASALGKR